MRTNRVGKKKEKKEFKCRFTGNTYFKVYLNFHRVKKCVFFTFPGYLMCFVIHTFSTCHLVVAYIYLIGMNGLTNIFTKTTMEQHKTYLKTLEALLRGQYDKNDTTYMTMLEKFSNVDLPEDDELANVDAFLKRFPHLTDAKRYMKLEVFYLNLSKWVKERIVKILDGLDKTQDSSDDDEEYEEDMDETFKSNADKLLEVARDGLEHVALDDWPSYYEACKCSLEQLYKTMWYVQGRDYSIRKGYEEPGDNPTLYLGGGTSLGVVDNDVYIFERIDNPRKKKKRKVYKKKANKTEC